MKRKANLAILTEIVICCFPILFFCGCIYFSLCQAAKDENKVSTRHSSVVFDFNNLWNMQFPEEFESAFVFYKRGGWMGEGYFYAVYKCNEYNEEFFADFTDDLNEEVEEKIQRIRIYADDGEYYEENYGVSLDNAYLPDFGKEFVSVSYHKGLNKTLYIGADNCEEYCDDHLYMSYFPETKMLYIYESIT